MSDKASKVGRSITPTPMEPGYPDSMDVTHRSLAVSTYNEAWSLLESDRGEIRGRDLLCLAMTSRYHWSIAGGSQECAIADWMVSRCFAAIGEGRLALSFAVAALETQEPDFPAWLLASLHEGLARAAASAHDGDLRDQQLALARAALLKELDDDDRAVVQRQIHDVPPG